MCVEQCNSAPGTRDELARPPSQRHGRQVEPAVVAPVQLAVAQLLALHVDHLRRVSTQRQKEMHRKEMGENARLLWDDEQRGDEHPCADGDGHVEDGGGEPRQAQAG